jgi:hypothetical protein
MLLFIFNPFPLHTLYNTFRPHIQQTHSEINGIQWQTGNNQYKPLYIQLGGMVFNATFNNISVLSWWFVLLVEETGVPGENHRSVTMSWCARGLLMLVDLLAINV